MDMTIREAVRKLWENRFRIYSFTLACTGLWEAYKLYQLSMTMVQMQMVLDILKQMMAGQLH